MLPSSSILTVRPDSETEISQIADRLLRRAGAIGVLPTPLDSIIDTARIIDVIPLEECNEEFLASLRESARGTFRSIMQKVRGVADLRKRAIYFQQADRPPRIRFVKLHELGHQQIPWHTVDPTYLDDDVTLSPYIQAKFEMEASFFVSPEIMFQGKRFREHALDYAPSFAAAFELADMHGASRQATIWRYVEEHDETLAVAQYYPTSVLDEHDKPVLTLWRVIPSRKFTRRYGDVALPPRIRTGDPWAQARDRDDQDVCEGHDLLSCGGEKVSFEWHAWWNRYTLLVLLRRRPSLGIVGKIFH